MKVYTKTGDYGTTSLVGGTRVLKSDIRLEAYGTIDELNAFIGDLLTLEIATEDRGVLSFIQERLFVIGANLALEDNSTINIDKIKPEDITIIENRIDTIEAILPRQNKFIMPTGVSSATKSHICRTVARRSERAICRLYAETKVDENILQFINRLSDYFFVLSRYCNIINNSEEILWDNHGR